MFKILPLVSDLGGKFKWLGNDFWLALEIVSFISYNSTAIIEFNSSIHSTKPWKLVALVFSFYTLFEYIFFYLLLFFLTNQ